MLTDNEHKFVACSFRIVCTVLGIGRTPITAYHPQTNGQAERYNKTLEARLRHYVSEHQDDLDLYVQPLTYAYNSQIHKTAVTSPFSLSLSRHLATSITDAISTANATDMIGPPYTMELRIRILGRLSKMSESTDHHTKLAQAVYKKAFNKKVCFTPKFEERQLAFIDRPKN